MDFDYGIIGGGPAGYTTGMMLAKQGKKVILFEKERLGGTCLNRGCIPTKSLLHSSELFKQCHNLLDLGIDVEIKSFDFLKIIEKKNKTVEKIRKALELAVKNSGLVVEYSEAEIVDKNAIRTNLNTYNIGEIIVATGSSAREVKGLEFDHKFILNSDDVLNLQKLPNKVLIVGSGAIGIEWARIFNNFGIEVYLVELASHLIPIADIDISKRIERIFKQKKIKFYLDDSIENINNKIVTLKSGNVIEPDFILSAVGRVPIKPQIDDVICIGDACGEIQLAHYAVQQAKKIALGVDYNKDLIPSVIYGEPEIAWVGIKEQDCDETYKKVLFPITALGKSWCDDSTEGFIKIIAKDDYIKGAHIISKEASALVQQMVIAMQNNIKIEDLKEVCFAHPTYSEGIFKTLLQI